VISFFSHVLPNWLLFESKNSLKTDAGCEKVLTKLRRDIFPRRWRTADRRKVDCFPVPEKNHRKINQSENKSPYPRTYVTILKIFSPNN
jgi:hypothetical protein